MILIQTNVQIYTRELILKLVAFKLGQKIDTTIHYNNEFYNF